MAEPKLFLLKLYVTDASGQSDLQRDTFFGRNSMLKRLAQKARLVRKFGWGMATAGRFHTRQSDGTISIRTKFGRFNIREADSDLDVLYQVFGTGDYDIDRHPQGAILKGAYEDMLRRCRTPIIIDAGANVGFASCYFQARYPKAVILAVEPDPVNAAICRRNTSQLDNVHVVEGAIGCEPGFVQVVNTERLSWAVQTNRSSSGVEVVTIPGLMEREPDGELLIVKIDVEGFESDLFAASTDWVSQAWAVFVEPHDWMLPGRGSSLNLQKVMLNQERELLIIGENLVFVRCPAEAAVAA